MEYQNIIKSTETCTLTMVRRVAAMLDLDPLTFSNGDALPPSWHFFLLAGQTKKSDLRKDGFPGLGVPMPDLGLPRLLLGGRAVQYFDEIKIGTELVKTSFIKDIKEKNSESGKMAIVTIQHELRVIKNEKTAIIETQTYILKELGIEDLGIRKQKGVPIDNLLIPNSQIPNTQIQIPNSKIPNFSFTPNETLLFQYSALGFNSHKIHLDRNYTQNIEGLPDLVVNGGLTTLLLTEYLRTNLGLKIADIIVKHIAPLYCNIPFTITSEQTEGGYALKVFNNKNTIAVEMESKIQ